MGPAFETDRKIVSNAVAMPSGTRRPVPVPVLVRRWPPGDQEEVGTLNLTGIPEVGPRLGALTARAVHLLPLALLPGQPDGQPWRQHTPLERVP